VLRFGAGIGERYNVHAPKAEIGAFTVHHATPDPALGARGIDDKVQALAVGIAAGGLFGVNAHGGKSVVRVAAPRLVSDRHALGER
jgi:hypothetical protein